MTNRSWFASIAGITIILSAALAGPAMSTRAAAAPYSEAPQCTGTGGRFALLIGNQDYKGALSALSNPRHDTEAFAKLLCANGFTVYRHSDLGVRDFDQALRRFSAVARGGKTAVVYYSGHGFAAGGRNWLVPIDAAIDCDSLTAADPDVLQRSLVNLSTGVLDRLKGTGDQVVILDACRTEPLRSCFKGGASLTLEKGLGRSDTSEGRLIVYATQDGQPALDSVAGSDTSPLMTAMIKRLPEDANVNWLDAMTDAGAEVDQMTHGVQQPNYDFSHRPRGCLAPTCVRTDAVDEALLGFIGGVMDRAALAQIRKSSNPAIRDAVDKRLAMLSVTGLPSSVATTQAPATDPDVATDCDRLAGVPKSKTLPSGVPGVTFELLDAARAVPACRAAHAAAPGNARITTELARALVKAGGADTEAFTLFNQAAASDEVSSFVGIAVMYLYGKGVKKNDAEAARWCRKAVDAGDALGMTGLGFLYENGTGVEKDPAEAARWYRKAADAGDAGGMTRLGFLYENGTGVEKNPAEAARWYRKAADAGDAIGMTNLGIDYENGTGVEKNPAEAARWYRKAADAGDARGMNGLGFVYENGTGVEKNPAEAARWYRKAADAGDARGMTNLGIHYQNGTGVEKNPAEAARWYRKAADAGDARGMTNLGIHYQNGTGVEKNPAEAARWYRKAADAGDAFGMFNLGIMYDNGTGVEKDPVAAMVWYKKAADAGNDTAMYYLGLHYEDGSGVKSDAAEATRWYQKAALAGNEDAKKKLKALSVRTHRANRDDEPSRRPAPRLR